MEPPALDGPRELTARVWIEPSVLRNTATGTGQFGAQATEGTTNEIEELREPLPRPTVTVAVVLLVTAAAPTVKRTLVEPAETLTVEGTVKAALLLETATAVPPAGAGAVNVTEQLLAPGETIDAGLHVSALGCIKGWTEMVAVLDTFAALAVIVMLVLVETVSAVAVKAAVVEPAATVTEVGTVRVVLLLERLMDSPPLGAVVDNWTVHVVVDPEAILAALQVSAERAAGMKSPTGATAMLLAAAPRFPE
jgi:hypothetical protein